MPVAVDLDVTSDLHSYCRPGKRVRSPSNCGRNRGGGECFGMGRSGQGKLLIFDCDGVLVDSEIIACNVQSRALAAYGLAIGPEEVARRFLGASARDMRAALETDLGRAIPADHEAR